MKRFLLVASMLALLGAVGCDGPTGSRPRRDGAVAGDEDGGSRPLLPDEDGDGIPDQYEGRADAVDTDGDGIADYIDDDSDGDGVPDSIEGGRPDGEPVDTDADGLPDFRDDDSDGNGIPDAIEGGDDLDGDRTPNSADSDNDGDTLRDTDEVGGDPSAPRDTDGDGAPDYVDRDSDGDNISDVHESSIDTDRDGVIDSLDTDSDADGIPDVDEAGDADPMTPPHDSDLDGMPDFRDNDADNDGLSDGAEREAGTDPFIADSDGDGVTDLVEVASGTNPNDSLDSPRTRGDFVFFEPYMAPPDPVRDTLDFATDIRVADVYFLMDTTGSMSTSVASLRSSLATFITDVRAEIPDVWIGVGDFKDYAVSPYGGSTDFAYRNCQSLTGDEATAVAGLSCYSVSGGSDGPESHTAALWAVATGMGLPGASRTPAPTRCPAGHFGFPCFRDGAVPIVILISDITAHNGPGGANAYSDATIGGHAPTYDETIAALNDARIRVIGIGQGTGGRTHLEAFARDTGAVDGGGAPLYSTWTGGAIGATVLNQIRTLASQTRLDISIQFVDDASDSVDSFAAFVDHVEANTAGDPARGCVARPATDTNADGFLDTFVDVTAGERVCFDIVVKQNDTVMPTTMPQLFRATLNVVGDGFTALDSRDVYFLVPPVIEPPGGPG